MKWHGEKEGTYSDSIHTEGYGCSGRLNTFVISCHSGWVLVMVDYEHRAILPSLYGSHALDHLLIHTFADHETHHWSESSLYSTQVPDKPHLQGNLQVSLRSIHLRARRTEHQQRNWTSSRTRLLKVPRRRGAQQDLISLNARSIELDLEA